MFDEQLVRELERNTDLIEERADERIELRVGSSRIRSRDVFAWLQTDDRTTCETNVTDRAHRWNRNRSLVAHVLKSRILIGRRVLDEHREECADHSGHE